MWLIAGVALFVRLIYSVEYMLSPLRGFYGADDVYYLSWAGRIAAGDWLGRDVFEQGPLYPYLLGVLFSLIGPRVGLVLALQLASGVITALLVYDCGRRLFDRTTGIAAGLLAATYGPLVFYECMLMKSFLSPLLTIAALAAGLRYAGLRRARWLVIAGIAVGLACLIQEHHILLLPPLIAWIWFPKCSSTWHPASIEQPRTSQSLRAGHTIVLVVAAAVCILPATLRNRIVAGEWVLVTAGGGEAFYMAQGPQARAFYNPPDFVLAATAQEHEDFRIEARRRTGRELTRSESSRYWFTEGLKALLADPLRAARLTVEKGAVLLNNYDVPDSQSYVATRHFVPALWVLPGFGLIGGLGLVGIVLCLPDWRRCILPLGFVAAHVLPILIFYNFGRLRIGMMPLWILFAACAGVWIVRQWHTSRPRALAVALAAIAISAGMYYPLLAEDFRLSDDKFIATLALRGQDYDLAEAKLKEIIAVLDRLPVEQSESVQYLAQVADLRRMLAEASFGGGKWRQGVEQIQALRRLPTRDDQRHQLLAGCVALVETTLRDGRLPPDSSDAALLRAELDSLKVERTKE